MIYEEDPAHDEVGQVVAPDFSRRRLRARLRRWRPFLIAGGAVLVIVLVGWLLYFSSFVTVRSVDVSGNTTLSAARIERIAEVPVGRQLVRVNLDAIRQRVASIPAVASVAVSRSWPHGIAIEVTERVPIAVELRSGRRVMLDADGKEFPGRAQGLPLVEVPADVSAAALVEAARVVRALRADVAAEVERVEVETVDKISLKLKNGVVVTWGSAEDSENKAQVLGILLKKGVRAIDVSVPGRPTTR